MGPYRDTNGRVEPRFGDTDGRIATPTDASAYANRRIARSGDDTKERVGDTNRRIPMRSRAGYRVGHEGQYGVRSPSSPILPMRPVDLPAPRKNAAPAPGTARRAPRTARNTRRCPPNLDTVFSEAPALAAAPVGPICDRRTLAGAPLANIMMYAPLARVENEDGQHGWILRHADGDVRSPLYAPGVPALVHTGQVLDVYVGLLVELARAEFPEDGRVRIRRQEFLRRIQWADENGHPAGWAYDGLDAAISYLSAMQIRSSAIERFEDLGADEGAEGELTFCILQAHGRVSTLQAAGVDETNCPDAGHRADDLVVYFSTLFVRLLRSLDQRVTYRLSHYLAFKRGAPRAFYRYVAHLATRPLTNGNVTVDLDDVFASLGSTLRGEPPARLRQIINDAPELLVELGLLREKPKFTSIRTPEGTLHRITLRPATPPTDDLKELLVHTLMAWMVTPSIARKWVDATPEWAATVVAAATLGMLECKTKLPAMVVDYLKAPHRDLREHELPRFKPTRPGQRRTATMNAAMQYLEEQFEANRIYLNGLAPDDQDRLRSAYSALNRPTWVVDGLVLATCRRFRSGWDLAAYLGSKGAPVRRR